MYCFFCAHRAIVWKLTEEILTALASMLLLTQRFPPFLKGGSPEAPQTPLIGSAGPDTPLIGSAVGSAAGEPAGTSCDQHRAAPGLLPPQPPLHYQSLASYTQRVEMDT